MTMNSLRTGIVHSLIFVYIHIQLFFNSYKNYILTVLDADPLVDTFKELLTMDENNTINDEIIDDFQTQI
jgi:hypothetical protein